MEGVEDEVCDEAFEGVVFHPYEEGVEDAGFHEFFEEDEAQDCEGEGENFVDDGIVEYSTEGLDGFAVAYKFA